MRSIGAAAPLSSPFTSQPPLYETATPAELAQAFWEWAESHDRNIPPLPLAAVSRASIYEDR